MSVAGVVFDLDGVLVDTEPLWAAAKREVTDAHGGNWRDSAPTQMLGMSGPEWSRYMHDQLAVPAPPGRIRREVVDSMLRRIGHGIPLLDGAGAAVEALAGRWPLGLASSADRPVIEAVLDATGLARFFKTTVSSDEAGRGKPAPDVYLAAAGRLGIDPAAAVAIEDSSNGMRAAKAAGMGLIAIPIAHTPVDPGVLGTAAVVLDGIRDLTPEQVERALDL
jgi:beta-phosphoglucomutase-like phosphatase (HAD superfamily)